MKNIQKIVALNFAICQLVADLIQGYNEFLLDRDLHDVIPRMGLDITVTHFKDNEEVIRGPFKGRVAKFCRVIITPVNWEADEFIECLFLRPIDGKNKSWWPFKGLLSVRNTHKEFWCEPNMLSGKTEFYKTFDQMVAEPKHSAG